MPRKLNVGDKVVGSWSRADGEQFTLLRHCDYSPTAWWMRSERDLNECWAEERDLKFFGFGLDVTFTNVDDAIAAATILSVHLNQPVPVIQK